MTGTELYTFMTNINGGATIDVTLAESLVSTAKAIFEEEREWMVLRKTNTALSIASGNTWETAININAGLTPTISDFSRFFGDRPFRLVDGNRREYFRQIPFDRRLEYRDVSNTFVYDANSGNAYINGTVPYAGTAWVNYIAYSPEVDLETDDEIWTLFPSRFHRLLGYYAVGFYKGAVDYDDVNARMEPQNRAILTTLKNAVEKWDNNLQMASIEYNDPGEIHTFPRDGAIDIYGDHRYG